MNDGPGAALTPAVCWRKLPTLSHFGRGCSEGAGEGCTTRSRTTRLFVQLLVLVLLLANAFNPCWNERECDSHDGAFFGLRFGPDASTVRGDNRP
jgi:hypothetical protein